MTLRRSDLRVAADIAEQPSVLARVIDQNADLLEQAHALVAEADLVRLLAVGSSRHVAGYGGAALEILAGVPATVLPAPGAAVPMPALVAGQVVIALSQSGETPALVQAVSKARERGLPVISITNQPGSRLGALATIELTCDAGSERVVAATKSLTAAALLLRAIAQPLDADLVANLCSEVEWTITKMDVSGALNQGPPESVICSGFAAEWIADEIALKFAEMAGRLVSAEPVVEFLHGPTAATASSLAFIDPDDPNLEFLLAGRGVVTVGPDDDFDVVTRPLGDPSMDAILRLVVGQRVVLEWALQLGENPDADRGLSKVTRTR